MTITSLCMSCQAKSLDGVLTHREGCAAHLPEPITGNIMPIIQVKGLDIEKLKNAGSGGTMADNPTPKPQTPEDGLRDRINSLRRQRDAHQMDEPDYVDSVMQLITAQVAAAAYIAASEELDRYTTWLTDNDPTNFLDYSHSRHKELEEQRSNHKEVI